MGDTGVCKARAEAGGGEWGRAPRRLRNPAPRRSHGWFPAACQPAIIMFNKGPKLDSRAQAPSL